MLAATGRSAVTRTRPTPRRRVRRSSVSPSIAEPDRGPRRARPPSPGGMGQDGKRTRQVALPRDEETHPCVAPPGAWSSSWTVSAPVVLLSFVGSSALPLRGGSTCTALTRRGRGAPIVTPWRLTTPRASPRAVPRTIPRAVPRTILESPRTRASALLSGAVRRSR